ncbi:MAG: hypothetical protein AB7I04_02450 [Pseudomonadales bacterium]
MSARHHAARVTGVLATALALMLAAASASAGDTRALVVAGLGGETAYEEEFQQQATRLRDRLADVTDDVTLLKGDAASTPAVTAALEELSARLGADDTLLFAFIGHGSWDDEHFRFNVPGKDFTAAELGGWLDAAPAENQIVIVTGAASGAVQDVLAADGRTLITGTRSGDQRNTTVFGRYFTAALSDDAADTDKDGRITAVEAFRFAEASVAVHYSRAGEMSVEHPVSSGPEPVLVLARLEPGRERSTADAGLIARRDELELDIASLKSRRDDYTTAAYFAELQTLLLEMATIEAQLTAKDGGR